MFYECNTGLDCEDCVGGCEANLEDGNIEYGFDDVTEHVTKNPGKKNFCCDFCGIYTASRPRCNECEEWD